jgi:hypothetical protein
VGTFKSSLLLPLLVVERKLTFSAPGGSTIVILFERGALEWDEDLLLNGRASLETLVRVNSGLGRGNHEFKSSVPGLTG